MTITEYAETIRARLAATGRVPGDPAQAFRLGVVFGFARFEQKERARHMSDVATIDADLAALRLSHAGLGAEPPATDAHITVPAR